MLPRSKRLKKSDFSTFFKHGKRFHAPHFTLVYTPHTQFHAAVVVSKKVAGKAVMRNRLRRQVYAMLRSLAQNTQGVWIVVVKNNDLIQKDTIHEELTSIMKRV